MMTVRWSMCQTIGFSDDEVTFIEAAYASVKVTCVKLAALGFWSKRTRLTYSSWNNRNLTDTAMAPSEEQNYLRGLSSLCIPDRMIFLNSLIAWPTASANEIAQVQNTMVGLGGSQPSSWYVSHRPDCPW